VAGPVDGDRPRERANAVFVAELMDQPEPRRIDELEEAGGAAAARLGVRAKPAFLLCLRHEQAEIDIRCLCRLTNAADDAGGRGDANRRIGRGHGRLTPAR